MSQLQVTGEAKIRDIQGPVVANSGVITALDGAASQYVRGDGTLADFPTSTGGGSSVSYYLNSSVSQGTIGGVAYRELNKEPIIGAGTDITISANGYVASYITDANDPDVLSVPGGNFNCEFYFSVNSDAHNPTFYAELYKYDGTTFTLLGSSQAVPESINQGTTIAPYYFAIPVATAALALTDRLAIRIYVNVDTRTVTLHTENSHLCQVVTTFSKGMVSLNNLTDQSQFITTGTSGTDFNIVSTGDTHTFNLPVASATNTGKLSSTDWTNFNAAYNDKINSAAVTGTTTKTLTLNQQDGGTITASWTDINTDAVTSVFGRTGAVVAASGDYTTTQVTEGTNLYFTNLRAQNAITLTTTGTSGAATYSGGTLNIPQYQGVLTNPVTGTGTTNTLPKFTAASTIGNSNITDSGTLITLGSNSYVNGALGIGTTSIGASVHIKTALSTASSEEIALRVESTPTGGTPDRQIELLVKNNGTAANTYGVIRLGDWFTNAGTPSKVLITASGASYFTGGNLLIGSTTDSGQQLQVNGTSLFQNAAIGTISTFRSATVNGQRLDVNSTATGVRLLSGFDTGITGTFEILASGGSSTLILGTQGIERMRIDNTGSVGIGTTSLTGITLNIAKNLTGATASTQVFAQPIIQSDVTGTAVIYNAFPSTQAAAFTLNNLYYYQANQSTIGATSAVTTQIGFRVASSLTGATNNFAFRSELAAATNVWNLYMNGTANNYLAGSLGIGSTALTDTNFYLNRSLTGGTVAISQRIEGAVQSDVTSQAMGLRVFLSTAATAFTVPTVWGIRVANTSLGSGSTINEQYGFGVADLTSGGTNGAYESRVSAGANKWGLYFSGTANNYLAGSLGIGSTSLTNTNLAFGKTITGAVTSYGIFGTSIVGADVTTSARYYATSVSTAASAFTLADLVHFYCGQGSFGAGSTVTNQYGFFVQSSLQSATNNYGFFGNIPSGTNRWNLYMAGTAANYMAGALGIGTTSLTGRGLVVGLNGTGATTAVGINHNGFAQSDVTVQMIGINNTAQTAAAAFALNDYTHFRAIQGTIGAGSSISVQTGFRVDGNLTVAATNYAFVSDIAAGTGRWNLYMNGSASNYLNGVLTIGTASPNASAKVQIDSTTQGFLPPRMTAAQRAAIATPATGLMVYQTDGVEGVYVYSGGSWKSLTMV